MYICLCHAVTDTHIKTAIDNGADTLRALNDELNVGSQCGKCCKSTKQILDTKLMQISEPCTKAA